jgi:hypothetical protein
MPTFTTSGEYRAVGPHDRVRCSAHCDDSASFALCMGKCLPHLWTHVSCQKAILDGGPRRARTPRSVSEQAELPQLQQGSLFLGGLKLTMNSPAPASTPRQERVKGVEPSTSSLESSLSLRRETTESRENLRTLPLVSTVARGGAQWRRRVADCRSGYNAKR